MLTSNTTTHGSSSSGTFYSTYMRACAPLSPSAPYHQDGEGAAAAAAAVGLLLRAAGVRGVPGPPCKLPALVRKPSSIPSRSAVKQTVPSVDRLYHTGVASAQSYGYLALESVAGPGPRPHP